MNINRKNWNLDRRYVDLSDKFDPMDRSVEEFKTISMSVFDRLVGKYNFVARPRKIFTFFVSLLYCFPVKGSLKGSLKGEFAELR